MLPRNAAVRATSAQRMSFNRRSTSGGSITLKSGKTSGVAIKIANSGQLLSLLDAVAPGPGGKVVIQATAPTGNSFRIHYANEGGPRVDVRVQELFGLAVHPTVAGEPLTFALLSPAHRPIVRRALKAKVQRPKG